MSKPEITGLRDSLPSEFNRTLGKNIYMTDLDCLHYKYENNRPKRVAIIDCKHGDAKKLSLSHSAMQVQLDLANDLNLPFFVCITYLHESIPMYFIKPVNSIAIESMSKIQGKGRFVGNGCWFSVYDFSRFQHYIRGIKFNEFEPGIDKLSRDNKHYPLPVMDF